MAGSQPITEFLPVHNLNCLFVLIGFTIGEHALEDMLAGLLIQLQDLLGNYVTDLRRGHVVD
jgi:hypothetical protein